MKVGDLVRIKDTACWQSNKGDAPPEAGETLIGIVKEIVTSGIPVEPLYVVMTSLGDYDLWREEIEEVLNESR